MTISVLIEPADRTGFRATGGQPFALVAEGPAREDILARLRQLIDARVAVRAEVVPLEFASLVHPWAAHAGSLRDSPHLEGWRETMAEYRRSVEMDELIL